MPKTINTSITRNSVDNISNHNVVTNRLFDFVVIISLIFLSNTVYARQQALSGRLNLLTILIYTIIIIISLTKLIDMRSQARIAHLWYIPLIYFAFVLSLIVSPSVNSVILHYAALTSTIIYVGCINTIESIKSFLRIFVNIVVILAMLSLLFWVFGSVLGIIKPTSFVTYIWDEYRPTVNSYYGIYFETQRGDFLGFPSWRNDGIFVEAPMYSFILGIALGVNALLLRERFLYSIVLGISILTTNSTTGYVALIIVVFSLLVSTPILDRALIYLRAAIIPVLLIILLVSVNHVLGEKADTGSYSVRSDHLTTCLRLFFESFPLGVGFGDSQTFTNAYSHAQGTSIGTLYLFAQGGLSAVVLYLFPLLYSIYIGISKRDWLFISFHICFAWEVFCTAIVSTGLFWVFFWLTTLRWTALKYQC